MNPLQKKTPSSSDRDRRRKTLLAGGVSLAVVGFLTGVQILGGTPSARAEAPVAAPDLRAFSFAPVVDRVRPAVVSIRVNGAAPVRETFSETFPDLPEGTPFDRWFREWGGPPGMGPGGPGPRGQGQGPRHNWRHGPGGGADRVVAQGSGFIISPDGKVVTNFHVVKGATGVSVVTEDGTEYDAKVVGSDEKTDVALLQVQGGKKDFPTVAFSTADVRPGDWVLAVGNPFGLGGSVTAGIVSARGREIGAGPYDDFLQIDAPINKGNSGGPTFDLAGTVVGMNTAIYSPSGGSVGIGFAIPAATVQKVIHQLENGGEVVRGWLGVSIQPIGRDIADGLGLKEASGALVAQIQSGTPAAKAGLQVGDAILTVDGRKVKDSRDLARLVAGYEPGTKVNLGVVRNGKDQTVSVELGRMPQNLTTAASAADDGAGTAATSLDDFGLALAPATGSDGKGLTVTDIDPTGIAAQRGVKVGDVVLEVQGKSVATVADVTGAIRAAKADGRKAVLLRLKSQDGMRFVPLPLSAS
ncbi:MAG: Do family serine endopeptidase [Phyllobacteriaceae bacterium]|nr:Do family serine endopeptidase [Phyllobacteriaceae bacterium]